MADKSSVLEMLFYESKPILLIGLAYYGITQQTGSQLGKLSVFMLLVCIAVIVVGRLKNRGIIK